MMSYYHIMDAPDGHKRIWIHQNERALVAFRACGHFCGESQTRIDRCCACQQLQARCRVCLYS